MEVTEFGRSIEVIAEREKNAHFPTDVIVFGIVKVCSSVKYQLWNAESPIEV